MKIFILLFLINIHYANANFVEFFGASATSSMLAGQSPEDLEDAVHNMIVPALISYEKKLKISVSSSYTSTSFEDINNIVIKNSINSNSGTETGNVSTDYDSYYSYTAHLVLPLASDLGAIGASFHSPIGSFAESNSGDPFKPEYIMYRSRYKRAIVHLNYAKSLQNDLAFSLGTHIGFQASANVSTAASLNGTSYGSNASTATKIKPSLGAIISVAKKWELARVAFSFHQEMKSNLEADTSGEINDPTSALFQIQIESMIYYDPSTFKLAYMHKLSESLCAFATLEYQLWDNYKTPLIQVKDKGGVLLGSDDYEKIQTKSIAIPKLALSYNFTESFALSLGGFYRPTPIEGDFSGAGNSIDSDSFVISTGATKSITLFENKIRLALSAQYHRLEERSVTKTTGQENGSAGSKIGAGTYSIGGSVLSLSTGLNLAF